MILNRDDILSFFVIFCSSNFAKIRLDCGDYPARHMAQKISCPNLHKTFWRAWYTVRDKFVVRQAVFCVRWRLLFCTSLVASLCETCFLHMFYHLSVFFFLFLFISVALRYLILSKIVRNIKHFKQNRNSLVRLL